MNTQKKPKKQDSDLFTYSLPLRMERLWADIRAPLFWSGGALISLALLVVFSVTQQGSYRLAQLPYEMKDLIEKKAPGANLSAILDQQLSSIRTKSTLADAQRMKTEQRLAELEQSLGDVTASIPQKTQSPSQALPATKTEAAIAPEPELGGATGAMTLASRTQFGIDLGTGTSMRDIRTRWVALMEKYGALMAGYEPLISVQDAGKGIELRLVAGPFADANEAAALCAKLRGAGVPTCAPSSYDGQRLALK